MSYFFWRGYYRVAFYFRWIFPLDVGLAAVYAALAVKRIARAF